MSSLLVRHKVGMNCLGEFSTACRNYVIPLVHHVVKTSVMQAHLFSILQLSIIQVPLNMKWCLHINYTLNYCHLRVIYVKIVRGIQNQVIHLLSRLQSLENYVYWPSILIHARNTIPAVGVFLALRNITVQKKYIYY